MMQDDVASSSQNKFPGKLFNKNVPSGPGKDVYAGCKVDYRGSQVTAKLFQAVLTGDSATAGGKVLKSTTQDEVFVNFIDHGGVGLIAFPNGPFLHAAELQQTLQTMHQKQMYNELLFYMEACESGSMFEGKLPTNTRIYAATAANAHESSYGYYCPPIDQVEGKHLGSCLGDLFSISWMEDTDQTEPKSESIADQLKKVIARTTKSHVEEYGDSSIASEELSTFLGMQQDQQQLAVRRNESTTMQIQEGGAVPARDIHMHLLYYAWMRAETPAAKSEAWVAMQEEQTRRANTDDLFARLAKAACAMEESSSLSSCAQKLLEGEVGSLENEKASACHHKLARAVETDCGAWSSYSMRYSRALWNMCTAHKELKLDTEGLVEAVTQVCKKETDHQDTLVV